MSRTRRIACCIVLMWGISIFWYSMTEDYSKYKKNKELYNICEVKITNTEYITRSGARWAYFQYEQQEGRVVCNFWEREGDIIEVAYDSDYNFIRKEIIIDDDVLGSSFLYIIGIIVISADIIHSIKKK